MIKYVHNVLNRKKNADIDTLSYIQLAIEVKVAFTYIDSLYNGWLTIPETLSKIDTLPIVFYNAKRKVSRSQQQQFYISLKLRLLKDSIVLIRN